jgi:hypothetical protein
VCTNHTLLLHRVSASRDGPPTLRFVPWFSDPTQGISHVAFSPDGKQLAAATRDGCVYVLPCHKVLSMQPSRLLRPAATAAGLPSFQALLHRRDGVKSGPVDGPCVAVVCCCLTPLPLSCRVVSCRLALHRTAPLSLSLSCRPARHLAPHHCHCRVAARCRPFAIVDPTITVAAADGRTWT